MTRMIQTQWGEAKKNKKAIKKLPKVQNPSYWAKLQQEKARTRRHLSNPKTRAVIITDLSKKSMNGTLNQKEGNLLLRALETEKSAKESNFPVSGDAMIRLLRKQTNIQARIKRKPKSF